MIFKKVKYRIKLSKLLFKSKLGIPFVKKETKLIVLNYHGLVKENPLAFNSRFITVGEFEKHLVFFKENFNVISLSESRNKSHWAKNKLNVVITFDDGYRNNFKYALPLLSKYNLPATFCITFLKTEKILWADLLDISRKLNPDQIIQFLNKKWVLGKDYDQLKSALRKGGEQDVFDFYKCLKSNLDQIRKDDDLTDYWELMTPSELKTLANHSLINIVPHGSLHTSLTSIAKEEALRDIEYSMKEVETLTGEKVDSFCYPIGDYNQKTKSFLREKGAENQLVVDYYLKEDVFEKDIISRFVINPHISFDLQMRFMYLGKYF